VGAANLWPFTDFTTPVSSTRWWICICAPTVLSNKVRTLKVSIGGGTEMEIEKRLQELGYQLPNPPVPAANYIGSVRVGNILFVGGNIGRINGSLKYRGKVGAAVSLEQAYDAARNCALNHLAIIKAALGDLDQVERVVKVLGYVNVAPGFDQMPKVVNGESDLLVQLWGERGQHSRAAVGVASLSQDAPVETEMIVQIKN
jgi:enamine deaminase RidA (YjgF/YER057c/UK114 family)